MSCTSKSYPSTAYVKSSQRRLRAHAQVHRRQSFQIIPEKAVPQNTANVGMLTLLHRDVFKARGMPYAMYRQVGAQIKIKAKANGYEPAEKAAAVKYPRTTTVHHSRSEPLNDPFQNGSPGGAGEYYVRIDDQDSAVSLSPARPPHGRPQHTDTVECAPQTQSDSSASAAKARLQHQENPSRATQVSRGSKRSFSSLQEEDSPSTGSTCNPQQSHVGQQTIERPAQRPRYSRPIVPSPQDPEAARVQAITAASPSLLTVSVASAPRAVTSGPPQASSQAQSVPVPQQPAVQRQVGQFNMAACRAMQVQARAAHAVPLQAPTAAVVQAQAAMLQAAQARAAQPPPPRVQLVDASRAQKLQAHYRRSQAPSEIEANQTRASQFASGFNQIVGSHGLIIEAAQAGIAETLEENEEHLVDQSPVNPLPVTQSLTDPSPIDPSLAFQLPLIQQSSVQQPTIGPSLINQSANFQSSSSPPLIQQSPRQQSTIDPSLMQSATLPSSSFRPLMHQSPQTLPVGPSTATSSPAFQQASTVDMPGKGKGVLPHAVARATFFINAKEKTEAISHLTKAWTAYSQSLAGSTLKERAAMWIVNFSLNFRQHWSLSTRSGSTLRETTLAQLTRAYADARSTLLRNATSNPGAAHFQFQQGHNVVDAQAAQQQHTMRARQV